jgi:hypothetical protein
MAQGKAAAAIPLLDALIRTQAKEARTLAEQGKALEKLSRYPESAHACEACPNIDPARANAHCQLASVQKVEPAERIRP